METLQTEDIKQILKNHNYDYETIVNKALNDYMSKIFLICPFTDKLCLHNKQCIGCKSSGSTI